MITLTIPGANFSDADVDAVSAAEALRMVASAETVAGEYFDAVYAAADGTVLAYADFGGETKYVTGTARDRNAIAALEVAGRPQTETAE